jgi:hypothetical protein
MTAQNRTPPAYQEYAANIIARFEYRTLTLPQRGLLYSMRLECWVNQYLPESPDVLARILGFDVAEIAAELPYVMPFFEVEDGRIFAPDLEAYRERLNERHKRQSDGAKATNEKRWGRKPRAVAGDSGGIGKRVGKRIDERVGERIASGSLLSIVQPSLAQPRGEVFNPCTTVDSTYEGWGDFTADPEQEGE